MSQSEKVGKFECMTCHKCYDNLGPAEHCCARVELFDAAYAYRCKVCLRRHLTRASAEQCCDADTLVRELGQAQLVVDRYKAQLDRLAACDKGEE